MIHELLFNMKKADVDVAIMEVSSHALDQYRVAGLDFDAGVLTNVTQDHLDYHGDMENYFRAKAKLFTEYPREKKANILNYNDPYGRRILTDSEEGIGYGIGDTGIVTHEVGDKPMVQGRILSLSGKGMEIETSYKGKSWVVKSPLIGAFNAMNLLAAQAVGLQLGLNCKDMRKLESFPGVPGRLERVMNDRGLDILLIMPTPRMRWKMCSTPSRNLISKGSSPCSAVVETVIAPSVRSWRRPWPGMPMWPC